MKDLFVIVPLLIGWVIVAVWFGMGNVLSPNVLISTVLLVCAFISGGYNLFPHVMGLYLSLVFQSIAVV